MFKQRDGEISTKIIKKTLHARTRFRFFGGLCLVIVCLGSTTVQAQTASYVLGTQALAVGPASGSNSVILAVSPTNAAWTATNNTTWLHLDSSNQSGIGSGVVVFSYDANPAEPRTGSLAIGDQTLSIVQAGSNYVQVASVATLVSGLTNIPYGVAVDRAGNVYFSEKRRQHREKAVSQFRLGYDSDFQRIKRTIRNRRGQPWKCLHSRYRQQRGH